MNIRVLWKAWLCLLLIPLGTAQAQDATLTGVVTDASTGEPLPGANVLLEELEVGAATDIEGRYTITVPAPGSYGVRATFIGYRPFRDDLDIGPGETVLDIGLEENPLGLEEVVVTALGREQETRKQGTLTTKVDGARLAQSGETQVLNALTAKAPGVNVTTSSGDPGAGSRIVIRGPSTIINDVTPLFVIDGVPISNASELGGGNDTGTAGVQEQSRINDLNPNDIESVEVLKGAPAAALYGSRAANGVVLITTKQGRNTQGRPNVTFSTTVSVDEVNRTIDLQDTYGQGSFGRFNDGTITQTSSSYGDRIANRPEEETIFITGEGQWFERVVNPDGSVVFEDLFRGVAFDDDGNEIYSVAPAGAYEAADENANVLGVHGGARSRDTFDQNDVIFDTGLRVESSLSISGGDPTSNYFLSIGRLDHDGVVQNNSSFDRTSVRLNAERRFTDRLKIGVIANYINTNSDRVQQASNISGIMLGGMRTPPDFNSEIFEVDFVTPAGLRFENRQRAYRNPLGLYTQSIYDNPLWTTRNNENNSSVNRFLGTGTVNYLATTWLTFTGRVGIDTYTDRRYEFFDVLASTAPGGQLYDETFSETQINADVFGEATYDVSDELEFSGLLGFNLNHRKLDNLGFEGAEFVLPTDLRIGDVTAIESRSQLEDEETIRTAALYSEIGISFANQLFLQLSGRAESASTIGPQADATFYYPSVQAAWEFTQFGALQDNSILSFGKIRAAWGQVGVQPPPYLIDTPVEATPVPDGGWGPELDPANYGGGFRREDLRGDPEVKPERKTEYEIGTDLRFFEDRIALGFSYYFNRTTDAILPIDAAPSTGFLDRYGNVAELENQGFEVELDAELLRLGDFSWTAGASWWKNDSEVTDLEGAESLLLAGFTGTSSRVVAGESYGVLWGGRFARDDGGNLILGENGFPTLDPAPGIIGNPEADWRAGIRNQFRYRGFGLSTLVDIKQGGDVWNGTRGALFVFGTHEDTAVETIVSQDQLGIINSAGLSIQDLIDQGAGYVIDQGDGTYLVRGEIQDFGAGPRLVDQFWWTTGGGGFGGADEQFVEDGGYVRLREISLSYNWSSNWLRERTGLTAVELTLTGRNLFTWTDYDGIDPETNLEGASNGFGLDYFQNPLTRSYVTTLRVTY